MKKLLVLISMALLLAFPFTVGASENEIVDEVGFFSVSEEETLSREIRQVEERYGIDILVVFTDQPAMDVAEQGQNYFRSQGDGLCLIVNMYESEFSIITTGTEVDKQFKKFLNEGEDRVYKYLASNNYAGATEEFLNWIVSAAGTAPKTSNSLVRNLLYALVGAGGVSLLSTSSLKSELKTEGKKYNASQYIVPNSVDFHRSGDLYLYSSRIVKRKDTGGGDDSKRVNSKKGSDGRVHSSVTRKF